MESKIETVFDPVFKPCGYTTNQVMNYADYLPFVSTVSGVMRMVKGAELIYTGVSMQTPAAKAQFGTVGSDAVNKGISEVLRGFSVTVLSWFSLYGIVLRVGLFFLDRAFNENGEYSKEGANAAADTVKNAARRVVNIQDLTANS